MQAARRAAENYEQVLRSNPGYLTAVNGLGIVHGMISNSLNAQGRVSESLVEARQSEAHYENYVRLNPAGGTGWNNVIAARERTASRLRNLGREREANEKLRSVLEVERNIPMSSSLANTFARTTAGVLINEVNGGRTAEVEALMAEFKRHIARSARDEGQEGITRLVTPDLNKLLGLLLRIEDDPKGVLAEAAPLLSQWQKTQGKDDFSRAWIRTIVDIASGTVGDSALRTRNWAEAERAARASLATSVEIGIRNVFDRQGLADAQIALAFALARQGRRDEAAKALEPAERFYEETLAKHRESEFWIIGATNLQLARSYVLTDPAQRRTAVANAESLLGQVSVEKRALRNVRVLQDWIAEAKTAAGAD